MTTKEFSIGTAPNDTETQNGLKKAVKEILKDVRAELDHIAGLLAALEVIVTK